MTEAPPTPAAGPPPPQADKMMAWLPHLLGLLTGWIGPLIIWLVKKDEDRLAAFHGKQALAWNVTMTIVIFIGMILCVIPGIVAAVVHLVYAIMAIVKIAEGKSFKYPWVADRFCSAEYAAAYPDEAEQAPPTET